MYKPLFDEHHKLVKVDPKEYLEGKAFVQRPSSGEYEANLLCGVCDNETLGRYESYAEKFLTSLVTRSPGDFIVETGRSETGIELTRCRNVDYAKFKLFLLSILWRASISKRDVFSDIYLGPYEEQLRKMIKDGDPGSVDCFPILIFSWHTDPSMPTGFISQPGKARAKEGTRYIFIISGMSYVFHVSPRSFDRRYLPFTLQPTNQITFFHVPPGSGQDLFRRYHDF
jgi:hypothetical protein